MDYSWNQTRYLSNLCQLLDTSNNTQETQRCIIRYVGFTKKKKEIILLFTVFFLKLYREMEFVACSPFLFRSPLLYVICPNRLHLPALPTPSAREQPNTSEQYSPPRAHLLISPLSFITCQDVPLAAFTSDNSPQLTRTSSGLHFSSQLSHLSGERFSFSKSRKGLVLMLLFFFY